MSHLSLVQVHETFQFSQSCNIKKCFFKSFPAKMTRDMMLYVFSGKILFQMRAFPLQHAAYFCCFLITCVLVVSR